MSWYVRGVYRVRHGAQGVCKGCIMVHKGCVMVRTGCVMVHKGCVMVRTGCVMVCKGCVRGAYMAPCLMSMVSQHVYTHYI